MSKKKTLLAILSAVIICSVSIMGTLAYLTKTAPEVTNIFTASGAGEIITPEEPDEDTDPINQNGFFLYEHKATKSPDGVYTLSTGTTDGALVQANDYDVLPGVNIPKDPFIKLKGLSVGVQAYIYVEVVDTLGDALTHTMAADWTKLEGVTGKNGGNVYVYKNEVISADVDSIQILGTNTVTVAGIGDATTLAGKLNFYGYLCQSTGFADATTAFNTCFG